MVEGAALEMLFRGNSNEGSNPSLSVLIRTFKSPSIASGWRRFAIVGWDSLALNLLNVAELKDKRLGIADWMKPAFSQGTYR